MTNNVRFKFATAEPCLKKGQNFHDPSKTLLRLATLAEDKDMGRRGDWGHRGAVASSAAGRTSVGVELLWSLPKIFSEMSSDEATSTGDVKYRTAERPKQFKHWVRPRSSLYSYLYDYQRNYYDDILDYLDRRRRGIVREIPRPQTWAERALRTYTQKLGITENAIKARNDPDLISRVHHSRVMHDFHTKDYYAKRFTMAVF